MTTCLIHAKPRAPAWHPRYREAFIEGLGVHGITPGKTSHDVLKGDYDFHILFGPNYWGDSFADSKARPAKVLCIDRCSVGNKNDFVTIGWNGWGGLGQYPCNITLPMAAERWDKWGSLFPPMAAPVESKGFVVVLGEYPSECDDKREIERFYAEVDMLAKRDGFKVYFRPHPHHNRTPHGWETSYNKDLLQSAECILTYKSSFGVQCRTLGYRVAAKPASLAARMCDTEQMAIDGRVDHDELQEWREWLLFTQWHISEIRSGEFWEHLHDA